MVGAGSGSSPAARARRWDARLGQSDLDSVGARGLGKNGTRRLPAPGEYVGRSAGVERPMTLETLQIGMEWFSERPGGLNRVYAHLLAELDQQGVESEGLVSGSPGVERISPRLARSSAQHRDRRFP